jgi:hypothetical protein
MTTSYPQKPADEIRSMLDEAQTRFEREVERLAEDRNRLLAEGWLFETSFDVWFPTEGAVRSGTEALGQNGYGVRSVDEDPRWLSVPVYLPFDDDAIAGAALEIDAVVTPFGGGVEGSQTDLDRRRRPES